MPPAKSSNVVYDENMKKIIEISTNYKKNGVETFYGTGDEPVFTIYGSDGNKKVQLNPIGITDKRSSVQQWEDALVTQETLGEVYDILKDVLEEADCTSDTQAEAYALAETAMKILKEDSSKINTEDTESSNFRRKARLAAGFAAGKLQDGKTQAETLSVVTLAEDIGDGISSIPFVGQPLVNGVKKIVNAVGGDTIARELSRKPLEYRYKEWKKKEGDAKIRDSGFDGYLKWKRPHATSGPISEATFRKIANGGAELLTESEFTASESMKKAFGVGMKRSVIRGGTTQNLKFTETQAYEVYKSMHKAAVRTQGEKVTEFAQEGIRILQKPVSETFDDTFKKFVDQYPGQEAAVADLGGNARDYLKKIYNQASVPNFYDFSNSEEYDDARKLFNFDGDVGKVTKREYDRYVQYAGTGNPILANRAARAAFETVKGAGEGILDDFMDTLSGNFDKIGKRRERPKYEQFKADMGIYNLSEEQLAALYTQTKDLDVTILANRESYQANMKETNFPKGVPYNIARMYNKQSDMWQNTPNVYGSDAKDVVSKYKNKEGFSDVMKEIYEEVQRTEVEKPHSDEELAKYAPGSEFPTGASERPDDPGLEPEKYDVKPVSDLDVNEKLNDEFGRLLLENARRPETEKLQEENLDNTIKTEYDRTKKKYSDRLQRRPYVADPGEFDDPEPTIEVVPEFSVREPEKEEYDKPVAPPPFAEADPVFVEKPFEGAKPVPSDRIDLLDDTFAKPRPIVGSPPPKRKVIVPQWYEHQVFVEDSEGGDTAEERWEKNVITNFFGGNEANFRSAFEEIEERIAVNDVLWDDQVEKQQKPLKDWEEEKQDYEQKIALQNQQIQLQNQQIAFRDAMEMAKYEREKSEDLQSQREVFNEETRDYQVKKFEATVKELDYEAELRDYEEKTQEAQRKYDADLQNWEAAREERDEKVRRAQAEFHAKSDEYNKKKAEHAEDKELFNEKTNTDAENRVLEARIRAEFEDKRDKEVEEQISEIKDQTKKKIEGERKRQKEKNEKDIAQYKREKRKLQRWEQNDRNNPIYAENREKLRLMKEQNEIAKDKGTDAATKKANIAAKLRDELGVTPEEAKKAAEEFVDGLDYNQPYEYLPNFMTEAGLKTALSSKETEDLEKWLSGVGKDAVTLSFAAFGVNTADLYGDDGKIDRNKALDALKKQAVLRAAFPTFAANRDMVSGTMTALGTYLGSFKKLDKNGNIMKDPETGKDILDTDKLASWTKSSLFIADVISFSSLALPFIAKGYEALLWARDSLYMPLEPYAVPDLIVTPLKNLSRVDEARWTVQAWRQDIVRVTNSLLENVEKTTEASRGILDASSMPGQSDAELRAIEICNGGYNPLKECTDLVPDWIRRLQRLPKSRVKQVVDPKLWGVDGAVFKVNGVNILGRGSNERKELEKFQKTLQSLVTETTFSELDDFKGSYYQEILLAVLLSTPDMNRTGVEVRFISATAPVRVKTKTIYTIPDPMW